MDVCSACKDEDLVESSVQFSIWNLKQIIFMKNNNNITITSNEFSFPSHPNKNPQKEKNHQNL